MKNKPAIYAKYKLVQLELFPEGLNIIAQEVCAHFGVLPSLVNGQNEKGKRPRGRVAEARIAICYLWRYNQVVDYRAVKDALGYKTHAKIYANVKMAIGYMRNSDYRNNMELLQKRLDKVLANRTTQTNTTSYDRQYSC